MRNANANCCENGQNLKRNAQKNKNKNKTKKKIGKQKRCKVFGALFSQ